MEMSVDRAKKAATELNSELGCLWRKHTQIERAAEIIRSHFPVEDTGLQFTITPSLASKLASIAVHADELFSVDGRVIFDENALVSAARDPEVLEWIKSLGPLAPVKRIAKRTAPPVEREGK